MKLAYFSPLNPQPSGISDYSEELLPYLAVHAEIDLFVEGFRPSSHELLQAFRWFDYREDPRALERLKEYDAVLYHMGNDHRYHAGIFDVMRTHPGIVVFHDFALQDFFLGLARERGEMGLYLDELAACHGEHERAQAQEHLRNGVVLPYVNEPLIFPLNSRLAQVAEGIVVHSRWCREQFAQIAANVPVTNIPMAVLPPGLAPQAFLKTPERRLNIASFGLITPGKGIEQTLRALSVLRVEYDFHYTLVGAENSYFDVRALIDRFKMTDRVTITGHLPLKEFERWILNTDIAVNLRERTVGETSASLCRIMGAGVPAIVSNVGAFAELPEDTVVKVDLDAYADPLLLAYLRRLLEDRDLRTRIGANARRYILEEHNVEKSVARYIDFIREVIARREGEARQNLSVNCNQVPSIEEAKPTLGTQSVVSSDAPASASRDVEPQSMVEYGKHRSLAEGMKLAYFSPLNPQASGISDYSEELLPWLAQHADIDLFVDGLRPDNPQITSHFSLVDYHADPSVLQRLDNYDAILYHVGNDHRYHAGIVDTLRKKPGIVVFHDFALQDFFLGLARQRGDLAIYLDEMGACHGKDARDRAEDFLRRGGTPPQASSPLEFPLNRRLAHAAEGIIVHSEWSRERFRQIAPSTPVARINHHITASAAALPFADQTPGKNTSVRVASFGLITPDKGIERVLRALAALRGEFDFHYTLVGSSEHFPELHELVRRYGLAGRVSVTGYVSLPEFERHIAETDIAFNLRERPVGATSGSLCRIMAAGVPAIVSNVGAFTELPNDAVVKIDNGENSDALLLAYVGRLLSEAGLRRRIGANARRHMLTEHNIEESAAAYIAFIREVIDGRTRRRFLGGVSHELSQLGLRVTDDNLLRSVAAEVAILAPAAEFTQTVVAAGSTNSANGNPGRQNGAASIATGSGRAKSKALSKPQADFDSAGRLPKIEGIDYKRAALNYPRMLDAERSYYLRTKPFYNLANKPDKHLGDGMDAETHRHFTDFANMAAVLALPPGSRVLDVGCGSGWLSEYFARLGYDVTGIDISDELIAMARERIEGVPYDVDHETPLRCRFLMQDIEIKPLPEKFDAIICYDSLHHFENERTVFRNLAAMMDIGGLLFILEGHKPSAGSATEDELQDVMRRYGTLESPFSGDYLRALLDQHGLAVVGDYVSVNGLFEREMIEGDLLPLRTLATDYHYLTCMKVSEHAPASSVPDSRRPGVLRVEFALKDSTALSVEPGTKISIAITAKNIGDTLWLSGQTLRAGVVMPGIRVIDARGKIVEEVHGHPMLPRPVAPGQSLAIDVACKVPLVPGRYTIKIDLVDQHICWFEEKGSKPLLIGIEVTNL